MIEQNEAQEYTIKSRLGFILYATGLTLGFLITIMTIWGDLEASLFDTMFRPEQRLTSLQCPILMTTGEESTISASFKNGDDRQENLLVRAHISQGFVSLMREEENRLTLPPGGEEKLEWHIAPEDAAWDRVVLVRISTVRNLPYRQLVGASCGILLVPIRGLAGNQIVVSLILSSLILMIIGGGLWQNGRDQFSSAKDRKTWRMMLIFAGLMLAALAVSLFQLWLMGMILILFIVLLAVSATDQSTTPPFLR